MTKIHFGRLMAMVALLALVGLPATARPSAISASTWSNGIDFSANGSYGRMVLRVSGGNQLIEKIFEGDAAASFSIDEFALADGPYSWELTLEPARLVTRSGDDPSFKAGARTERTERIYESGYFTVVNGAIADSGVEEPLHSVALPSQRPPAVAAAGAGDQGISAKDVVHLDDTIVQFSLCVGNDCVNGESFGFDTIRMKENNVRMHFDDTSTSASFPRNDWRLIANDSSNGGGSYLAIEDSTAGRRPFTVEAAAPANTLYVEADGDVGIKTNNPVVDLHVVEGNTPTLRLEQDGSDGFTPQTWDVAGNEANFFIRDVTNGSKLSFRIRPGAPESSIDIAGSGDIGVGTSAPTDPIHVRRTDAARTSIVVENTGAQNTDVTLKNSQAEWAFRNNTAGDFLLQETGTPATELTLTGDGDLTIRGQLVTQGPQCPVGTPCDGVFRLGDELESIEEHAAFMWENSYLPAVGPTAPNQPINLPERTGTMLNELEKAHIYIEQLHQQLGTLEARLEALEGEPGEE